MNKYQSAPAHTDKPQQPLSQSLEVLANLIYLAGLTETYTDRQRHYLDRAASVIAEMRNHPKLHD